MSQDVVKAFYDQLISDQTSGSFYDRVSGRIYELEGPTNAALPLAVFSLITSPYADTFDGSSVKDYTFQVDIYGRKRAGMSAAGAINTALFTLLDRQTITVPNNDDGLVRCLIQGVRTVEDDAVRIRSEWIVQTGFMA